MIPRYFDLIENFQLERSVYMIIFNVFFTIVFNCFIIFHNKYICEIGRVTWMLCVHNKSSITLSAVVVGLQN